MQFSLQSLMLSFVVVAAAIGVCGPWGIALAVYLLALAASIRRARTSKAAVIGFGLLLILGGILSLGIIAYIRYAREMDRREKCAMNLRAIGLSLQNYESAGCRAIVITADAKSAGCQIARINDVPLETRQKSVAIFLSSDGLDAGVERLPLDRVYEELELGERSKLFETQSVDAGPWYLREGTVAVRPPDGITRSFYCEYLRHNLDTLLASDRRMIKFAKEVAFPRRINWAWLAALAILIVSEAVLLFRRMPQSIGSDA
jgi:hypothetical protein